jgi:hypothetical protein
MLLQIHNSSIASTFSTTDADASDLAPTSQCTQNSAKEQRQPQQPKCQEQCDPHQHHHHLETSRHVQRRTPKKGRDIGNNIFVGFVKHFNIS